MVARLGGGAYLAVHAAASLPGSVAVTVRRRYERVALLSGAAVGHSLAEGAEVLSEVQGWKRRSV